jgi:hypothetical protein
VALPVDVIVVEGITSYAVTATDRIPIVSPVMMDPVERGFAASLSRPGGNITCLTLMHTELNAKRLDLLRAAFPNITAVAALVNPANPSHKLAFEETETAARSMGLGSVARAEAESAATLRALRPAIFSGASGRPTCSKRASAEHTRMRAVRTKMTIPPVMDDIGAMLAFLEQQKEVKRGVVGCHGYCMSGPYALAAAARYPDRIAAAASFYGTWLVSEAEESPHLSLGKVKGELYIGCAEHDKLAPLPMVQELSGAHQTVRVGQLLPRPIPERLPSCPARPAQSRLADWRAIRPASLSPVRYARSSARIPFGPGRDNANARAPADIVDPSALQPSQNGANS